MRSSTVLSRRPAPTWPRRRSDRRGRRTTRIARHESWARVPPQPGPGQEEMPMSSLWIVVIGVVVIYLAYTLYARRIDRTIIGAVPTKATPARMYMDGADFMPTSR